MVDIRLDVNASPLLELAPTGFLAGGGLEEPLPELGRHHFADVRVRDEADVMREVFELVRSAAARQHAGRKPGVIGNQTRTETDKQDQQRSDDEITGSRSHGALSRLYAPCDIRVPLWLIARARIHDVQRRGPRPRASAPQSRRATPDSSPRVALPERAASARRQPSPAASRAEPAPAGNRRPSVA